MYSIYISAVNLKPLTSSKHLICLRNLKKMVIKEETEKSLTCMDDLLQWFSDCVLRISRTGGDDGVPAKAALGQESEGRKEGLRREVSDPRFTITMAVQPISLYTLNFWVKYYLNKRIHVFRVLIRTNTVYSRTI